MDELLKGRIVNALVRLTSYIDNMSYHDIELFTKGKDFYAQVLLDNPKDWSLEKSEIPDCEPIKTLRLRLSGEI